MIGGTYLVVRDIQVDPAWHALTAAEQERDHRPRQAAPARRSAARRLFEKPDLERLAGGAHIRQASPRTSGVTILRRGYDTPQGLLFLAFMQRPAPPVRCAPAPPEPPRRAAPVHDGDTAAPSSRFPPDPLLYAQ